MKKPEKVGINKSDLSAEEQILRVILGEKLDSPPRPKKPVNPEKFSQLKERLGEVLKTLTEREQKVLEMRFGLGDGYRGTLEEIGKQFKVSRERIRQIEAKALLKMRHPKRIRQLEGFHEGEKS